MIEPFLSVDPPKANSYYASKTRDPIWILNFSEPVSIISPSSPPPFIEVFFLSSSSLMASVGETHWIEDESQMDGVTAISGSGPAYLFHVIECLEQSAKDLGLPNELAHDLAIETIYGSAALAKESAKSAEKLRENVTSPGGTTEAALNVLMGEGALQKLFSNAALAAKKRSKELK